MRFKSLDCASQTGTPFYTECCYPLNADEDLASRPAHCTPAAGSCPVPSTSETTTEESTPPPALVVPPPVEEEDDDTELVCEDDLEVGLSAPPEKNGHSIAYSLPSLFICRRPQS